MDLNNIVSPFKLLTYRKRRADLIQRLSKLSPEFTAFFWSGSELQRNGNSTFPFHANSDFFYLTGFAEPETLIILQKKDGDVRTAIGVRPRDLSSERGSEIWDGPRVGVERAPKALGFDEAFDIHQAGQVFKDWAAKTPSVFWSLGYFPEWDKKILDLIVELRKSKRGIPVIENLQDPAFALHQMRKIKSSEEIEIMRRAGKISALGHIRAMKTVRPGMTEYQLAAELEREFKRNGSQVLGYTSIVAGGNNACILHYIKNEARLKPGELVLIDAACELEGYSSDITRTFPVSGKYSPAQRQVYNWVLKAQLAAIQAVKPGAPYNRPHEIAAKVLSQGLCQMGFFGKKSATEVYAKGLYKAYFPHNTSHWIGLDTHDVGRYRKQNSAMTPLRLETGNVMTIEPGLYFRKNDRSVPEEFRGIGIRIEDDVAVTKKGFDVLTSYAPKTIEEIEKHCGGVQL